MRRSRVAKRGPERALVEAVLKLLVVPAVSELVLQVLQLPLVPLRRRPMRQRKVDAVAAAGAAAAARLLPVKARRLRAVEKYRGRCSTADARVLRRGLSPLSYSSLLIDVAERATPTAFAAMGLADTSSHLYQRILAMESRRSNRLFLRAAGVAIIGLAGLLAACEAKMPTAADVEHMDASSAERSAKLLGVVTPDSALVWSVDGVASTEAAAKAIPADSIVTVNVGKFEGRSHIYMTTKGGQRTADAGRVDTVRMTVRHDGHVETVSTIRKPLDAKSSEGEPLLFIDGVRTDPSVLKTLDRTRIERVDVLKGELATRTYGADGSKGVIVITTKSR